MHRLFDDLTYKEWDTLTRTIEKAINQVSNSLLTGETALALIEEFMYLHGDLLERVPVCPTGATTSAAW